uniref:Uncharacterized protein n=1 Tax=Anguilla anguilla TaxID=7936 RepID=A0A0E9R7D7_ANGAN
MLKCFKRVPMQVYTKANTVITFFVSLILHFKHNTNINTKLITFFKLEFTGENMYLSTAVCR